MSWNLLRSPGGRGQIVNVFRGSYGYAPAIQRRPEEERGGITASAAAIPPEGNILWTLATSILFGYCTPASLISNALHFGVILTFLAPTLRCRSKFEDGFDRFVLVSSVLLYFYGEICARSF